MTTTAKRIPRNLPTKQKSPGGRSVRKTERQGLAAVVDLARDGSGLSDLVTKNKRAIQATIFGMNRVRKEQAAGGVSGSGLSSGEPKGQSVDPWRRLQDQGKIVAPPFDPLILAVMPENNTEIRPAIEAMSVNVESFGWRANPRIPTDERTSIETLRAIAAEKVNARNFFRNAFADECSLEEFREKLRVDLEATGNAYIEEIERPGSGDIDGLAHLPSWTMRIGVQDAEPTEYVEPGVEETIELEEVAPEPEGELLGSEVEGKRRTKKRIVENRSFKLVEQTRFKRFRRYVQTRYTSAGNTKATRAVWFKEIGDPRLIDCRDGHVVTRQELTQDNQDKGDIPRYVLDSSDRIAIRTSLVGFPVKWAANPVRHIKLFSTRSPYGLPRYVGHLFAIFGSRAAEEINYTTFKNNNIPSAFITVNNGSLTEESIDRLDEFVEAAVQSDDNYSKFILLEADPSTEGMRDPGAVKIEIKPMTAEQHSDALFREYQKENDDRVRRAWRLPPIFVGKSDQFTGEVVDSSRRLADEQIFGPERTRIDNVFTKDFFVRRGLVWTTFKTNSANVTENGDLIRIISAAEKSGGVTPRIARHALSAVLNDDLGEVSSDLLEPDQPFTLTLAQLMKSTSAVDADGGGQPSSQGRTGLQVAGPGRDRGMEPAAEDLGKMLRSEIDRRFGGFVSTAFDHDGTDGSGDDEL